MITPKKRPEVLSAGEAREALPRMLRQFRDAGDKTEPVFMGAHRKPDGVLLSYESYERLMDLMDDVAVAAEVLDRTPIDRRTLVDVDDLIREFGYEPDELGK